MKLVIYLNFGGNCEEAFRFYAGHLGGELEMVTRFGAMPEAVPRPPGYENKVMHARLRLAGNEIYGSDVPPDRFQPMRSAYLSLNLDSTPEVERVYQLLQAGGEVFMPLQETFFAHRFAMLRDRFGVSWMLIHEKERE